MNYLGHAFFSTEVTFLGNMAGDSLKGIRVDTLPGYVQNGIHLHQRIDRLTDTHISFTAIKGFFNNADLPYGGVLADLTIDYGIASRWELFSNVSWQQFKEDIYSRLETQRDQMPGYFPHSAYWLVAEDWFESYRSIDGMRTAFYRLSRKTRRPIDGNLGCEIIAQNLQQINDHVSSLVELFLKDDIICKNPSKLLSHPCISKTS